MSTMEQSLAASTEQSLKAHTGRTTGQLLSLLTKLLKNSYTKLHSLSKKRVDKVIKSISYDNKINRFLASPALVMLKKIQAADQLSVESTEANEQLVYWMRDFGERTAEWRQGVDQVVGNEKDLLRDEAGWGELAANQLEEDALNGTLTLQDAIGNRLSRLAGTDLGDWHHFLTVEPPKEDQKDELYLETLGHRLDHAADADAQKINGSQELMDRAQNQLLSSARVVDHLKNVLSEQESANFGALKNENDRLLQQMAAYQKSVASRASPASFMQRGDHRRRGEAEARRVVDTDMRVESLLDESRQLEEEHEQLTSRHQAAGQVMQHLVTKVQGALV
jgi:hypothetical protein